MEEECEASTHLFKVPPKGLLEVVEGRQRGICMLIGSVTVRKTGTDKLDKHLGEGSGKCKVN